MTVSEAQHTQTVTSIRMQLALKKKTSVNWYKLNFTQKSNITLTAEAEFRLDIGYVNITKTLKNLIIIAK